MSTTQAAGVGPLKFSDKHYEALGRLVVAFQYLEQVVTQAIVLLVEPAAHKKKFLFLPGILNEMSFGTRLRVLSNIVTTTDVSYFVAAGTKYELSRREEHLEIVAELLEGIALAGKAEEDRNRLIHSQWMGSGVLYGPAESVLRVKSRMKADKTQRQEEYVKASDILAIVDEMDAAARIIGIKAWLLERNLIFNIPEDAPDLT